MGAIHISGVWLAAFTGAAVEWTEAASIPLLAAIYAGAGRMLSRVILRVPGGARA